MDCKSTKDIDINSFLQKKGFTGVVKNSFTWYCSPFRDEKTASFRVSQATNRFNDFSTGDKGDILDLVKLMYNTDTSGALQILNGCNIDESFSFSKATFKPFKPEPGITINWVQPVINNSLIQYLSKRKISLYVARLYTVEAYYTVKDKQFFSIGFKNDKNGYELRNPYFKSCSSPKYFTTIPVSESKQLNLFEGFFDFLSALEYYQVTAPKQNTIVLNSLSMLPAVLPLLANYEKINLYLDNDKPGQQAAEKIRSLHLFTEDKAKTLYPLHKDFNEYLLKTKSENKNNCKHNVY